jgi:hypothetical protein
MNLLRSSSVLKFNHTVRVEIKPARGSGLAAKESLRNAQPGLVPGGTA